MRFSESWKIAASASLRTSSAGVGLFSRARDRGIGGMDQAAQQRLVADDLDVVLDARPVGNAIEQRRDVSHVADRLQFLLPVQLLDQRDDVDRPRRLGQIHHARVDAPVRIEREIFRPQMLGRLVVGEIVEQDRAQNGALGFHIRGKHAEVVIRGRQFWSPCLGPISFCWK